MSLDVSEAIALAKDLLKTSNEFRAHDTELAEQFAGRAFEICDDLGIDRTLIGELSVSVVDEPDAGDDAEETVIDLTPAEAIEEETRQTGEQLRNLLQQQARVLQNAREMPSIEEPKASKRSFSLFGRSNHQVFGRVQSASA